MSFCIIQHFPLFRLVSGILAIILLGVGNVRIDSKPATTALIATLDGTMYLVDRHESGSLNVIWSFSTGSPIYSSYQALVKKDNGKENASAAKVSGFVECGDDWSL